MSCPNCKSDNVSIFKGWVEDIKEEKFSNNYAEDYWDFMICNVCKIQSWTRPDKK